MFLLDEFYLKPQHFHFGSTDYYDGTCDALSVRETEWPYDCSNVHDSGSRIELRQIIELYHDDLTQVSMCIALALMSDHTGREYWQGEIEGDTTNTRPIGSDPVDVLRELYEELAAGYI